MPTNAIRNKIERLQVEIAKHQEALDILMSLEEGALEPLFSGNVVSLAKHKKNVARKVAPKWRHKKDKTLTWSGRGRQPKWIKGFGVKLKSA